MIQYRIHHTQPQATIHNSGPKFLQVIYEKDDSDITRNFFIRDFNKCVCVCVCVCVCALMPTQLHYYALEVPRKVDRWRCVRSIFVSRTSICILYWKKLRLG